MPILDHFHTSKTLSRSLLKIGQKYFGLNQPGFQLNVKQSINISKVLKLLINLNFDILEKDVSGKMLFLFNDDGKHNKDGCNQIGTSELFVEWYALKYDTFSQQSNHMQAQVVLIINRISKRMCKCAASLFDRQIQSKLFLKKIVQKFKMSNLV